MIRSLATCCFGLCWLLVIAGTVMYHVVVAKVLPPLKDLPVNLATGFDDVLRFNYMEQDARTVRDSAANALSKCNVSAVAACWPSYQPRPVPGSSNTGAERASMVAAFQNSLGTIERVAGDRYFGTPQLQVAAQELSNLTAAIAQLNDTMECARSNVLFCGVYNSAGELLASVSGVRAEIDRFKGSEAVDSFEDYSPYFFALHFLPYLLVIAMLFFTCFWCQGGICCGEHASRFACCTLIPFAVFWCASFVLMLAVVAGGAAAKGGAAEVRIKQLQGDPTAAAVLEHIEAKFPEFWNLVFAQLFSGLRAWVGASTVLTAICVLVALYGCCLCCAQPYRKNGLVD